MKSLRISKNGLFVILMFVIIALHQAGIIRVYYLTAIIASLIVFIYAIFTHMIQNGDNRHQFSDYNRWTLFFCSQWIIVWIYNILLFITGIAYTPFMKSSFIQMFIPFIVLLSGWGIFRLVKEYSLKVIYIIVKIGFVILIIYNLFKLGSNKFIEGVLSVFSGNSIGNPLESNADLVFSTGLLVIFYANKKHFDETKNLKIIISLVLLIFLCGKRSQAFALLLLAAFSILTAVIPERKMYKVERIVSIALIITYYGYIFLVKTGVLYTFLLSHGINSMGRIKMWSYVIQNVRFLPSYLGYGFSYSTLMVETDRVLTYYDTVFSFHGNVLAYYVDLGFILFGIWMIFNLLIVPNYIKKHFKYQNVNLYWEMTIYLFVLYLTESSLNHPMTQAFYVAIILYSIMLTKSTSKK